MSSAAEMKTLRRRCISLSAQTQYSAPTGILLTARSIDLIPLAGMHCSKQALLGVTITEPHSSAPILEVVRGTPLCLRTATVETPRTTGRNDHK